MSRFTLTRLTQWDVLAVALSLALTACDDTATPGTELTPTGGAPQAGVTLESGFSVTTPLQGAVLGMREVAVTGTHATAQAVNVNGDSVPVMGGRFSVTLNLDEGTHVITVSDLSSTVDIDVMVDLTPPSIEIGSPSYGAHIDSAQTTAVGVVGSSSDEFSGVAEVSVNGVSVPTDPNGAFQYTFQPSEGLVPVEVKVTDRAGHEATAYRSFLYGRFKEWATPVQRSTGAFISAYGLDALERAIKSALDNGLISELIVDAVDPSNGVEILGIEVMDTVVSLEPRAGYLDVALSLQGLRVTFNVESPSTSGDIYVDAMVSAKLYLDVLSDGSLDVRVVDPMVDLANFDIYANGAIGVGADFLEGFIGDLAEQALLSILQEVLVESFVDPSLFRPTLTVLQTPLQVEVLVESAEINPEGVDIKAGLGLASPDIVRQAPGYLYDVTPAEERILPSMISAFATLNGLQMILGQIWRAGLIDINLLDLVSEPPSALSGALLAGFTDGKLTEYMAPTDPVGVRLRPSLPPVGRFVAQEPQALYVDLNDLLIDLTLPSGDAWLTLGLNLTARVEPGIISNDLQLTTSLEVAIWPVATPLFPVDTDRVITLFKPLILNLPNLVGVQAGSDPLISISELELFGVQLSTTTFEGRPAPGGVALIGLQVFSP